MDEHDAKATYFVVGLVAEEFPDLVREIHDRGHEVATHGYWHKPVDEMSPEEFEIDLEKSLDAIEAACGYRPIGYRAPLGSLDDKTLWVLDILKQKGLKYDSSIYPANPLVYGGVKNFRPDIHEIRADLWEVPLSAGRVLGLPFPISGGFYLRLLPFKIFQGLMAEKNRRGESVVLYYHSWEFQTRYPRIIPIGLKRFIQYYNLDSVHPKLKVLLNNYCFRPLIEGVPS